MELTLGTLGESEGYVEMGVDERGKGDVGNLHWRRVRKKDEV